MIFSFKTITQTHEQLTLAGFNQIRFIYDETRIFPTVTAIDAVSATEHQRKEAYPT